MDQTPLYAAAAAALITIAAALPANDRMRNAPLRPVLMALAGGAIAVLAALTAAAVLRDVTTGYTLVAVIVGALLAVPLLFGGTAPSIPSDAAGTARGTGAVRPFFRSLILGAGLMTAFIESVPLGIATAFAVFVLARGERCSLSFALRDAGVPASGLRVRALTTVLGLWAGGAAIALPTLSSESATPLLFAGTATTLAVLTVGRYIPHSLRRTGTRHLALFALITGAVLMALTSLLATTAPPSNELPLPDGFGLA